MHAPPGSPDATWSLRYSHIQLTICLDGSGLKKIARAIPDANTARTIMAFITEASGGGVLRPRVRDLVGGILPIVGGPGGIPGSREQLRR